MAVGLCLAVRRVVRTSSMSPAVLVSLASGKGSIIRCLPGLTPGRGGARVGRVLTLLGERLLHFL